MLGKNDRTGQESLGQNEPGSRTPGARHPRRRFLKGSVVGAGIAGLALTGAGTTAAILSKGPRIWMAAAGSVVTVVFPTSPLILSPFTDPLPIPRALAPVPKAVVDTWAKPPGPGVGAQDSWGGTHQIWPAALPLVYQIKLQVAQHWLTSSRVLPTDKAGKPVVSYDATKKIYPAGTTRLLPGSTTYAFNGSFPGPMINAEYGKPAIVRFENHLDQNPGNFDRQDFGTPDHSFLTHLHNGHTAPESDGNPNYTMTRFKAPGYAPGQWVDNLYLNYPAGGDDREKQSFLWFHDHRMDFTSSNVYKGMVGLYPIYDPTNNTDMGDERVGLRLPGVRRNNADGSFDVDYDIPLAVYDALLDDGTTVHQDAHSVDGNTHPEWWGQSFFRHFPDKGFVGDIFTVNGKASPVLTVKRRKYRLRFLNASIARGYEFKLMRSAGGPKTAISLGYSGEELQGQYRIPDGRQSMRVTQIATDGGLLPSPLVRDSFELWPGKRREFVVDFTKYMDGSPTRPGDVVYLTNTMKMTNGLKQNSPDSRYLVPVLKIVIGDAAPDNSVMPVVGQLLRAAPALPAAAELQNLIANRRVFTFERTGSLGGENEWAVNGHEFDPAYVMAKPLLGSTEAWEFNNKSGGWVHPVHPHQEEHLVVSRNGVPAPDARNPDDTGKEDVVMLAPGEEVVVVRKFRTFKGSYVAHCHNLAHEDHHMMFGWEIV